MHFYHEYLSQNPPRKHALESHNHSVADGLRVEEAIYEFTKLKRKLLAFWYYPGRPIQAWEVEHTWNGLVL